MLAKKELEEQKEGVVEAKQMSGEQMRAELYNQVYLATKKVVKLNRELIKKAVQNLKSFSEEKKSTAKNLLEEEDDYIHVTITLAAVPLKFSPRPIQIPLKYPIYGPKCLTHACLIVKDPQRKYKDLAHELDVPCLAKIVGYEKLLKNFKQYKDRRQLIHEFDLFFCDKRIYPMLPKVTGSFFYKKKKFPYPIKLTDDGSNMKELMEEALKGTYMMVGNGPNYSFKVAKTSMQAKECVSNVMRAVYKAIPHIIKSEIKPTKIQSITIKTSASPELPIYSRLSKSEALAYLKAEQETK